MTTARDLIKSALKKINELGVGQTLSAEDAQDGLTELNGMIALWSTQRALIFTETKETFSLTGASSYTIGSGGDFNTTVPRKITSAYATFAGIDHPIQIIDSTQYSQIELKTTVGVPSKLYFDGNYPTANIYLYPINYTGTTLTIISEKPLTTFATLDTDFALPPEYELPIVNNLAVKRAPDYQKSASPDVKIAAKQGLDWIKSQNNKNFRGAMRIDSAYLEHGDYDIYSGHFT